MIITKIILGKTKQSSFEEISVNEFNIKAFFDTGQEIFYITYNEISLNGISDFAQAIKKIITKNKGEQTMNQFNKNQDDFNATFGQWLRKIAETLTYEEITKHFPEMQKWRELVIQHSPTPSKSIRFDDFLEDIKIILSDELNGGVTKISKDTLLVEFPHGDIFRLVLVKDVNSDDIFCDKSGGGLTP